MALINYVFGGNRLSENEKYFWFGADPLSFESDPHDVWFLKTDNYAKAFNDPHSDMQEILLQTMSNIESKIPNTIIHLAKLKMMFLTSGRSNMLGFPTNNILKGKKIANLFELPYYDNLVSLNKGVQGHGENIDKVIQTSLELNLNNKITNQLYFKAFLVPCVDELVMGNKVALVGAQGCNYVVKDILATLPRDLQNNISFSTSSALSDMIMDELQLVLLPETEKAFDQATSHNMTIIDPHTGLPNYAPKSDYAKQLLADFDKDEKKRFPYGGPSGLGE